MERDLPQPRGDVVLDCELLKGGGNEGIEYSDEEEVMQVSQPMLP